MFASNDFGGATFGGLKITNLLIVINPNILYLPIQLSHILLSNTVIAINNIVVTEPIITYISISGSVIPENIINSETVTYSGQLKTFYLE